MNKPFLLHYVFLSFLIFSSCEQKPSPVSTADTATIVVEDSMKAQPVADIAISAYDFLKDKNSPQGLKLGQYYASDDNELTFCANGNVKLDYSPIMIKLGKWEMRRDTIFLSYTLLAGKKGIGEPLPPPLGVPGNYIEQYKEYQEYEENITEKDSISWIEIKELIKDPKTSPYQLLDKNADCTELKKFRK